MVCLNVSRQKTHEKKFVPVFRIEIIRILMATDFVLQIGWLQTFFLWKYLILSHFLILKTPTEDSILCHKRRYQFFTKGAFACLMKLKVSKIWFRAQFALNFQNEDQQKIKRFNRAHNIYGQPCVDNISDFWLTKKFYHSILDRRLNKTYFSTVKNIYQIY
jgi:hypothetical protein